MSVNRALDEQEIQRLFQADKIKELWPGNSNMILLAKAVKDRKHLVEFENGSTYTIRYNNNSKTVFIRPVNEELFVPCGYFEYDKLKEIA